MHAVPIVFRKKDIRIAWTGQRAATKIYATLKVARYQHIVVAVDGNGPARLATRPTETLAPNMRATTTRVPGQKNVTEN
jgi:hypothetical protein